MSPATSTSGRRSSAPQSLAYRRPSRLHSADERLPLLASIMADLTTPTREEDLGKSTSDASTPRWSLTRKTSLDADILWLAELGYSQDMQRNFSLWSILGVGFSLTNSWFGISAALVTGINSGGPVLVVYGIIIVALVSTCIGISLSELASAIPSAGGQYVWASELAPSDYADFAAYLTGWFAWAGSLFTSASVSLALAFATVGCYSLSHPEYEYSVYHIFVAYEVINIFAFCFNCYGRTLPFIATTTLYISLVSFAVILVTVPASAPSHQPAHFVFSTFINNTGWESSGMAFIVGLVNCNWAFSCLDCATHLAEEVSRPERTIPISIMSTVAIGFVTSWLFGVSMFFSIVGPFENLLLDPTGRPALVPILQLFYHALTGRAAQTAGAIVLESLIIATGLGCLIACHTWSSRLCWSFARDHGLPYSPYLCKIDNRLGVPLRAHVVSTILVAVVGLLYLGSATAFNSMVTACIVLLYVSYAIPVGCLLLRGRDSIKHGPFWLGGLGAFANYVLLAWTLFAVVMYSFPYTMPVRASTMNYVSAVYAIVVAVILIDWYARGKGQYRGQTVRKGSADVIVRRASAAGAILEESDSSSSPS